MSEITSLFNGDDVTDGLFGHWEPNDGSGDTATDSTENENAGMLVNNSEWVDSIIAFFDGSQLSRTFSKPTITVGRTDKLSRVGGVSAVHTTMETTKTINPV